MPLIECSVAFHSFFSQIQLTTDSYLDSGSPRHHSYPMHNRILYWGHNLWCVKYSMKYLRITFLLPADVQNVINGRCLYWSNNDINELGYICLPPIVFFFKVWCCLLLLNRPVCAYFGRKFLFFLLHSSFMPFFFMEREWKEEVLLFSFFLWLCLPKLEQIQEPGSLDAFDEGQEKRDESKRREEVFW